MTVKELTLDERIAALEDELNALYRQRAGALINPCSGWAWCAACGRKKVCARAGHDTCGDCLR